MSLSNVTLRANYINLLIQAIPTVISDRAADFWFARIVRWKLGPDAIRTTRAAIYQHHGAQQPLM